MAFTSAVTRVQVFGNRRFAYGTWNNAARGDSGGSISTGLKYLNSGGIATDTHLGTEEAKAELNKASAGQIRITTSTREANDVGGTWWAIGL